MTEIKNSINFSQTCCWPLITATKQLVSLVKQAYYCGYT